ncbi:hypothetical protein GPJ56_010673 [Histomonas meleagridis]|uniref:uncharacterized protein n=1 Tax=Histomonas meleagridis TaxID=135588 RepID=UPI003559E151|nr:hypothetical protein GPJ56_010673 [Histomonas meleagridis]KAH0801005.1 hypothetical protein GO595_006040 [Histomonas meleagridis]
MLYSRAAFFSPLFIRYIYSSFCPILSPILPQIKYQNFDNQIGEIQEKILANCRSHSNLFPQYILDILVVEATQEQGSNVIFLRNVFINYALHPSYHNISFLQILGFIESHQTPNEQFYEFLHKLFTNKFLRELIKIFSESYNESEIKYIEGKNRENLPSMFQPSILTNYDIISLQNNRKPFEPPNELTFHTISWWTKLHTWVDSDTDLRKSQSAVFKQRIREFLIETDFIPRCNYGTSLDDYMNELVDKGPINKIESRKVEANFIKEQLQQKSENEIKKLLDDIIIDDKEDLMKLSAFTPMIFQLQDLDEQVKPIIQRMFYIAKDFLLRSTIEKYFMNKRKLELKDVINNPNLLKQELTDLMSYVKHENDIVKEKVITEESITDTCYSYLTSSFNYNEFIEFKPELKEEDSMVYEKLSTSENEIMEKLENLLPDKKYLERAKKLLKEKNIFSGMKDAFGINDIYSFGKQLNVAIGMARFQFTKGFSAMDVGPDQLMPFFVTFYSLFHPKDFASRFEFLKMFYIGFFPNETTTFTCYQSALKNGGLDIQI